MGDPVRQAAREHELANALMVAEATVCLLAMAPPDIGGLDTVAALRQALETVRRIATTSRVDEPDPAAPFDLGPLLDGVVLLVRSRGLQVEVVRPDRVHVVGCRGSVHQVVLNLLANALQHGGCRARMRVTRRADVAEVAVSDDGPGLPPAVAAMVRPGSPTPPLPPGPHGMGLALSLRMARAQGGDLWAAPSPSGGTSLVLSLPLAPEVGSASTPVVPRPREVAAV